MTIQGDPFSSGISRYPLAMYQQWPLSHLLILPSAAIKRYYPLV